VVCSKFGQKQFKRSLRQKLGKWDDQDWLLATNNPDKESVAEKTNQKRAHVVSNRRGLLFHYRSAPLWVKGCLVVYYNPQYYTSVVKGASSNLDLTATLEHPSVANLEKSSQVKSSQILFH
jgi:hypothetical protein